MPLASATKTRFEKRASMFGTDRTGRPDVEALRTRLRNLRTDEFKQADSVGGEPEGDFEQAFSSLGYSFIKDKAPRLLDYIVGFQLVERNEDNTKACGVFGFKVGPHWFYIPIFFLNGDLKGHELLYAKKQDMFVPLKENWVNYLIARQPHTLGEGSAQNTMQLGGLMPNLSRLSRPPSGIGSSKYGSADDPVVRPQVDEWAEPFLPVMMAMMEGKAAFLYPGIKTAADLNLASVSQAPFTAALSPLAEALDLRTFLAPFPLLKLAYEKLYRAYPLMKQGFDRFYGPNFFTEMGRKAETAAIDLTKSAESWLVPPKAKKKPSLSLFDNEPKPDKHAGLTVIALDVDDEGMGGLAKNRPELTDAEREKLLKDTVLIKDERDPHATSTPYDTQVSMEMTNPDVSGLYQVLEKPGTFDEMVVIARPHTGRGREEFHLVVRKSDPRSWKNVSRTNLWIDQHNTPTDTDFKDWVDGLKDVGSLAKGGTYVLIHRNGSGTCPFEVKENYGDDSYRVSWSDSVAWEDRPRRNSPVSRDNDWDLAYSPWNAKLTVNRRKGSHLRSSNGELSVPEGFKVLKVKDPPKPKQDDDLLTGCCPASFGESDEGKEAPIRPGNIIDVQLAVQKEARALSVLDLGGNEVYVRGIHGEERMSKKAALLSLVRDHGLREGPARTILKQAEALSRQRRPATVLVKYAYGYGNTDLQQGAPTAPAIPEPPYGTEQMGPNSVQSIYPQEEFQPVEGMQASQTDPSVYDPWYQPDTQATQIAQQAAAGGQKEVFDTSSISSLLKAVSQESLVDKYMGPLMKALDALGRILLLSYWHAEDFQERYGKADMPEFQDGLRNTFAGLGDTLLYAMEREVRGRHEFNAAASVGPADRADPDMTDVARN